MLSIIGLASPSSQTRVSRSTTAGFATEVTATPELSEESWTASSPSPSPCFGIKPSTTLRSERTLTRAQRRFPLDQEWGVHPPGPEGRSDLVGTESCAGRERQAHQKPLAVSGHVVLLTPPRAYCVPPFEENPSNPPGASAPSRRPGVLEDVETAGIPVVRVDPPLLVDVHVVQLDRARPVPGRSFRDQIRDLLGSLS